MINQPPDEDKKKLLKLGWVVLVILLIWTMFSPWGLFKYFRLEKELERVRSSNRQLQQDNQKLKTEIDKLTTDPAYIESIAREEHGLLRNNEVIYQFPSSKKKPSNP